MKTIYDIVRGFALKYQIAIFTASFVFVVCSGIFIYQTVRTINTAYTEYTYREEIKEYDRQKQEVIAQETEKIKMLNDKVEALKSQLSIAEHNKLVQVPMHQACIAKQKLGVHEGLSQCEYPDSLVGQVNASESIESDRVYSSQVNATGGTSPVPKQLAPNELFYTTAVSDKCHVSQGEEDHFKKQNGGMLATDVACRFGQPKAQRAVVYAPDYLGESLYYKITKVGNDKLLGDYIELGFGNVNENGIDPNKKWIIAHIETKKKVGDIVQTGEVLGQQNLSGATTGYHTHIELWKFVDGSWINVSYSTRSKALSNKRTGKLDDTVKIGMPIYSTQYNLGDVNQNDDAPNIGASGKDLRHVKNPIALTVDVRKLYNLKFGDKIKLNGPCPGTYSVEDEMNIRYRTSCVQKEGGCIKMDIAIKPQDNKNCSGLYTIQG